MLKRLVINNVALISDLSMEMDAGLNILTGETGAGKSIIVDSLMLLLGGRYDKTLLKYGEAVGYVEGFFTDVDGELFESIGLEAEEDAVIKRRFSAEGKNDIRINGQSVTLSMLKRFSGQLVDIYGQNEHQSLTVPAKHLSILDFYIRNELEQPLCELGELVGEYNEIKRKIARIGDEQQRKRSIDILAYQIEEIKNANIGEEEESEILERRKLLLSSERIKTSLGEAASLISGEDSGRNICEQMQLVVKSLVQIASLSPAYEELLERMNSLAAEAIDIGDSIDSLISGMEYEEGELDELEQRLDVIRGLKRKYGDYTSMMRHLESSEEELSFLENAEELSTSLMRERIKKVSKIYAISKEISELRRKCAKKLEGKVISELNELGMQDSRFEVVFNEFPSLEENGSISLEIEESISCNGMDKVEFYLSANPGQPLLPLAKIISGGEMSRFMLALKVISAATDTVQTMIFDEIDAGISGSIGRVIACKLATISRQRQVVCVTHLPQIAAMADTHYFISKQITSQNTEKDSLASGKETKTVVRKLTEEEMISEISRLSGGQDISSAAASTAREIKKWSENYKNSL